MLHRSAGASVSLPVKHYPPFDGHVTGTMLAQLRPYLPRPNAYRYQATDFQPGAWPFDAYCQPAVLVQ
jgi:hypothetical protein